MRPILRYLRIAFTETCVIACVLLIALWMRSYQTIDSARNLFGHRLASMYGTVVIGDEIGLTNVSGFPEVRTISHRFDIISWSTANLAGVRRGTGIAVPFYLVIFPFGIAAVAPWVRQFSWRFSLRSLLIATTLVAVVLGRIVWLR